MTLQWFINQVKFRNGKIYNSCVQTKDAKNGCDFHSPKAGFRKRSKFNPPSVKQQTNFFIISMPSLCLLFNEKGGILCQKLTILLPVLHWKRLFILPNVELLQVLFLKLILKQSIASVILQVQYIFKQLFIFFQFEKPHNFRIKSQGKRIGAIHGNG